MAARHEINELLENIRAELPTRAHELFEEAVQRAAEGQRHGRKRIEREMRHRNPWERQKRHYQEQEGALAIFMLVVGFLGGLAFMYLFDPERGEKRRAALRGQAERLADEVEAEANRVRGEVTEAADKAADSLRDQVSKTADDASGSLKDAASQANKTATGVSVQVSKAASSASDSLKEATTQVKNAASEVKQRVESAATSDATLLPRVRVEIARNVRSPGSIEIEVKDGAVMLTGQIRAGEVQTLVEKINALPGVRSVDNRLEIHDALENTSSPSNGATP
jgi:uncharacterized protein YjbJ (UPF0337 family)/cation transport regulator ChaB